MQTVVGCDTEIFSSFVEECIEHWLREVTKGSSRRSGGGTATSPRRGVRFGASTTKASGRHSRHYYYQKQQRRYRQQQQQQRSRRRDRTNGNNGQGKGAGGVVPIACMGKAILLPDCPTKWEEGTSDNGREQKDDDEEEERSSSSSSPSAENSVTPDPDKPHVQPTTPSSKHELVRDDLSFPTPTTSSSSSPSSSSSSSSSRSTDDVSNEKDAKNAATKTTPTTTTTTSGEFDLTGRDPTDETDDGGDEDASREQEPPPQRQPPPHERKASSSSSSPPASPSPQPQSSSTSCPSPPPSSYNDTNNDADDDDDDDASEITIVTAHATKLTACRSSVEAANKEGILSSSPSSPIYNSRSTTTTPDADPAASPAGAATRDVSGATCSSADDVDPATETGPVADEEEEEVLVTKTKTHPAVKLLPSTTSCSPAKQHQQQTVQRANDDDAYHRRDTDKDRDGDGDGNGDGDGGVQDDPVGLVQAHSAQEGGRHHWSSGCGCGGGGGGCGSGSADRVNIEVQEEEEEEEGSFMGMDSFSQHLYIRKLLYEDLKSNDVTTIQNALRQLGDMCHRQRHSPRARYHDDDDRDDVSSSNSTSNGSTGEQQEAIKANNTRILDAGGHFGIIWTMEKFALDETIQAEGCRALQHLVMDCACAERTNIGAVMKRKDLRAAGNSSTSGGGSTLQAPYDEQRLECGSPLSLSRPNEEYIRTVVACGAIAAVVAAMKTHECSPQVQIWGSGALYGLSFGSKAIKNSIIKKGGLPAVCRALQLHKTHRQVQSRAHAAGRRMVVKWDQFQGMTFRQPRITDNKPQWMKNGRRQPWQW